MGQSGQEAKRITGAASVVGGATFVSRLFGYARDAAIAYVFGASFHADAFFVAFRVSNLMRRLVGEGALTSSFVPVFTDVLNTRTREEAALLSSKIFTLLFVLLVAFAALGVVFADEIVWLLSPGFASSPRKLELTVSLTRLLFPYIVFIGFVAASMGVLNSLRHFMAPAVAPVLFNVSIILAIVAMAPFLYEPVYALVAGVLMGGLAQFLFHVPYLKRFGMIPRPAFGWGDPHIKKLFMLMAPAALGVGVYQLNIFVTLRFASGLPDGSVSYLYYAGRIMELPLGVFAVAVSTAALPSLSECVTRKDWASFKESLSFALRFVNFVTIPSTAGLLLLGPLIIDVLFKRGEFGQLAAGNTAFALQLYAVGLVPVASARVLVSIFYSLKDARTPMLMALVSFFANIILCMLLIGPLLHAGLALATSLSAFVNFFGLMWVLRQRFGTIGGRVILKSALKSSIASIAMVLFIFILQFLFEWDRYATMPKALFTIFAIVVSSLVYVVAARALKTPEVSTVSAIIKRRF